MVDKLRPRMSSRALLGLLMRGAGAADMSRSSSSRRGLLSWTAVVAAWALFSPFTLTVNEIRWLQLFFYNLKSTGNKTRLKMFNINYKKVKVGILGSFSKTQLHR